MKSICLLALLLSSLSLKAQNSAFGVNLGFGQTNINGNSASRIGVGLSYGQGNPWLMGNNYGYGPGFMGAPIMGGPAFGSFYNYGAACFPSIMPPIGQPLPYPGIGRFPTSPIPPRPVPSGYNIGRGPLMPNPMPYPIPGIFPPIARGPCIPCSGAIYGPGIPFPMPPQGAFMGNQSGISANGGVNVNYFQNGIGANGSLIAALGMGLAAQNSSVVPMYPVQRVTQTIVVPQKVPVPFGPDRDASLFPRGAH